MSYPQSGELRLVTLQVLPHCPGGTTWSVTNRFLSGGRNSVCHTPVGNAHVVSEFFPILLPGRRGGRDKPGARARPGREHVRGAIAPWLEHARDGCAYQSLNHTQPWRVTNRFSFGDDTYLVTLQTVSQIHCTLWSVTNRVSSPDAKQFVTLQGWSVTR